MTACDGVIPERGTEIGCEVDGLGGESKDSRDEGFGSLCLSSGSSGGVESAISGISRWWSSDVDSCPSSRPSADRGGVGREPWRSQMLGRSVLIAWRTLACALARRTLLCVEAVGE